MNTVTIYWSTVSTPHGDCVLMASNKGIIWAGTPGAPLSLGQKWINRIYPQTSFIEDFNNPILSLAGKQLQDYTRGKKLNFSCPFDLHGTPFQVAVWEEMLRIPYGKTRTYGEMAALVGKPKAPRAVGGACNRNPIAILVPCHRIVGRTGNLTGYAGGISTKKWLLELEQKSH